METYRGYSFSTLLFLENLSKTRKLISYKILLTNINIKILEVFIPIIKTLFMMISLEYEVVLGINKTLTFSFRHIAVCASLK